MREMRHRERLLAVAVVLLSIGGLKLGQQVYRWYAFADERSEIGQVEGELREAGLGIVRTQILADSLRLVVEQIDSELATRRDGLDRHERQLLSSRSSSATAAAYRAELRAYNDRVAARNELFRQWSAIVERNHKHVERYNLLADSVRSLAARIGELYYPVLSPAEIAERDGLLGEEPDTS